MPAPKTQRPRVDYKLHRWEWVRIGINVGLFVVLILAPLMWLGFAGQLGTIPPVGDSVPSSMPNVLVAWIMIPVGAILITLNTVVCTKRIWGYKEELRRP